MHIYDNWFNPKNHNNYDTIASVTDAKINGHRVTLNLIERQIQLQARFYIICISITLEYCQKTKNYSKLYYFIYLDNRCV